MPDRPDDDFRRLIQGIDFSPLSQQDWQFQAGEGNVPGFIEKYRISYGMTEMGLIIDERTITLGWFAELPTAFMPGNEDNFFELRETLLNRLPSRIFRLTQTSTAVRGLYKQDSAIQLVTDDSAVRYRMGDEKDNIRLALAFVKPDKGKEVRSLTFEGRTNPNFTPDYTLTIVYPTEEQRASLLLATRFQFNGEKAWNRDTLNWVIAYHANRRFLGSNADLMARQLSEGICAKVSGAVKTRQSLGGFPMM